MKTGPAVAAAVAQPNHAVERAERRVESRIFGAETKNFRRTADPTPFGFALIARLLALNCMISAERFSRRESMVSNG
jgi:hypothetical protein